VIEDAAGAVCTTFEQTLADAIGMKTVRLQPLSGSTGFSPLNPRCLNRPKIFVAGRTTKKSAVASNKE